MAKVMVYKFEVEVDPKTLDVAAMVKALETFGRVTVTDWVTRRV